MKVTFVYRGFESLGIEYLSAALKERGHNVTLVYDPVLLDTFHLMNNTLKKMLSYFNFVINQIINSSPDLVAFSVTSDDYSWACKIAEAVKQRKCIPIIFGGIHPTCMPEGVINQSCVDYACVGEGEEAIVELVEALENGRETFSIANIWAKENGRIYVNPPRMLNENLDSLPLCDKDLFYDKYKGFMNTIYMLMAGRGCPYICSYCYSGYFKKIYQNKGSVVRQRSVINVINELRLAKKKYKMKRILFVDDVFTSDINWLKDFLGVYKKEIHLPFGCLLFPNLGDRKKEVLSMLNDAGCTSVGMGIQSVYQNRRQEILLRPGTNKEIEELIKEFKKTKIFLYADIMLGIPLQNETEVLDTAYFLNKNRPDAVATLWLRYYPKAEIGRIALEKGAISENQLQKWDNSFLYSPISRLGSTFDKKLGRLNMLLLISHILPSWLLKFIINKKIYKIFPAKNMHYFTTNVMIFSKLILQKKKGSLYFSFPERVRYIFYFIWKKMVQSGKLFA